MAREPWEITLDRAAQHLSDLERRVQAFLDSGAYRAEIERPEPGTFVVRLVVEADPPDEFSAMTGDVLHNTRSALDCMVPGSLPGS